MSSDQNRPYSGSSELIHIDYLMSATAKPSVVTSHDGGH